MESPIQSSHLNQDFLDLLRALSDADARFLIEDMIQPDVGLQIDVESGRIDVLTKVSGVGFADAWARRTQANFGDVRCGVIGLDDLLINKRAAGRPQDLADVSSLEELQRIRKS